MLHRSEIGQRIRARRLARGLSQKDLARAAGISSSYLNLIEHDRRRIGASVLGALAAALDTAPEALSAEADRAELTAAADRAGAETEGVEALAQSFPGWANLVVEQARAISELETRVSTLSDRMGHDPVLSAALHQVLSTVTSIRSTASILVDGAGDRDWERRFHQNVHDDSLRLTEVSQALVTYLEDADQMAPFDAAEQFFRKHEHHFERLEQGLPLPVTEMDPAAQALVEARLAQYRRDADQLPLAEFSQRVQKLGVDPLALSRDLGCNLAVVLRRLASLPANPSWPAMGLLICDRAGGVVYHKPVAGFELVRAGAGCPNWPIYEALAQPGYLRHTVAALPEDNAPRLTAYAVAEVSPATDLELPPRTEATMLVIADAPTARPRPVGTTCQACQHEACAVRRLPSVGVL